MNQPLAALIRPKNLDDMVGQTHLLGKDSPLRKLIEVKHIPNMIFYGPSGCGKTTANIIAAQTNKSLYKINATTASSQDVREVIASIGTLNNQNGILLYIDEIQYFSKKQQQVLLEYIENGDITLIASTTENPYFYIYNALLSRSTIFEFKSVSAKDIAKAIQRAISILEKENNITIETEKGLVEYVSSASGGDVRKAINTIELLYEISPHYDNKYHFSLAIAEEIAQKSSMKYDRDGDAHYDLLSAFQKSIRGSEVDAAIYYLAKLCHSGDLEGIIRRLIVTAYEDIGLANPPAVDRCLQACNVAREVGFPEAIIPLSFTVSELALSPKSKSSCLAIEKAMNEVNSSPEEVRDYLKLTPVSTKEEDRYPYDRPDLWEYIEYLPEGKEHLRFYEPNENGNYEKSLKINYDRLKSIKRSTSLKELKARKKSN